MPSILFLTQSAEDAAGIGNDNHRRLPQAFKAAGWSVAEAPADGIHLLGQELQSEAGPVGRFDRIWQLGFGNRATFLDRMQLLATLETERFVTTPQALLLLHGKCRWLEHMPETHISNDPARLLTLTGQGGDWVLKPLAGSFARGVTLLKARTSPGAAPLTPTRATTGETTAEAILRKSTEGGRYVVLQRYLDDIRNGETRVLCAAGQLLGHYLRIPQQSAATPLPVANLAAGAGTAATGLGPMQRKIAQRVANDLLALGVGFAAIDLIGDYLLEVNVANPGGLARLAELDNATAKGTDNASARVVTALEGLWNKPR